MASLHHVATAPVWGAPVDARNRRVACGLQSRKGVTFNPGAGSKKQVPRHSRVPLIAGLSAQGRLGAVAAVMLALAGTGCSDDPNHPVPDGGFDGAVGAADAGGPSSDAPAVDSMNADASEGSRDGAPADRSGSPDAAESRADAAPDMTSRPANPVSWTTPNASLSADDFWIVANGQRFTATVARDLEVHSDPGDLDYTTLELTWHEVGREMRLFIYFKADATHWWSEEVRTYDGQSPAEWLYYDGIFFRAPLGSPFEGDVDLGNNGPDDRFRGTIHFKNLRLNTTFRARVRP